MNKFTRYLPAIASFLLGVGLQVSGITIPWLGYSLMIVGVLLLLIPGWTFIKPVFKQNQPSISINKIYEENKGWDDGKLVNECGLIFTNSRSINLVNCYARLLDLGFETLHKEFSLDRFPKSEDLLCDGTVAGFSNGKIPLFRWKGNDNSLDIIYRNRKDSIGYGVVNSPILLLLNVWADTLPAIYVVCKLEKLELWGYQLSILKSGLQGNSPSLSAFQIPVESQ